MKSKVLISLISLFVIILVSNNVQSQENDTLDKEKLFELSFGQSMIFMSYEKTLDIWNSQEIGLPTSAMLFIAEVFPEKRFRIPLFFNVPTEAKQYVIDNQLVNVRAAPTFGIGVEYKVFQITLDKKTYVEWEAGPLASVLINKKQKELDLRFAPVIANRFRIVRNRDFVMYFGTTYSIGINAWGILYGTGYIF
jgi:hypothetical protein